MRYSYLYAVGRTCLCMCAMLLCIYTPSSIASEKLRYQDVSDPGHILARVKKGVWVERFSDGRKYRYHTWWLNGGTGPRIGIRDKQRNIDMFLDVSKGKQKISVRDNRTNRSHSFKVRYYRPKIKKRRVPPPPPAHQQRTYRTNEFPIIGTVTIFAGNYEPRGFMYCDGRLLSINQYQALFSILGTSYGGNGRSTFALPDFRRKERKLGGARYIIAVKGIYPSRR